MTRHKNKDMTKVFRSLERDHGCEIACSPGGHWRITRDGVYLLTCSGSGSFYAVNELRRDLRRYHGIEV